MWKVECKNMKQDETNKIKTELRPTSHLVTAQTQLMHCLQLMGHQGNLSHDECQLPFAEVNKAFLLCKLKLPVHKE